MPSLLNQSQSTPAVTERNTIVRDIAPQTFLMEFEKRLPSDKIKEFYDTKDGIWKGDISETSLYHYWLSVKNEIDSLMDICGNSTLNANLNAELNETFWLENDIITLKLQVDGSLNRIETDISDKAIHTEIPINFITELNTNANQSMGK